MRIPVRRLAALLFVFCLFAADARAEGGLLRLEPGVETAKAAAGPAGPGERAPGELLVRVAWDGCETAESLARDHALSEVRRLAGDGFGGGVYKVGFSAAQPIEDKARELLGNPQVLDVQPNYIYKLSVIPDDKLFREQWGLYNTGQTVFGRKGTPGADIGMTRAWDSGKGAGVVVAVVDTGIDMFNPELVPNLWVNAGEVPGNLIDDDNNGYVDDTHGINAITGTGNPQDDNGHGTHVAGIIGAQGGNGEGIAGITWDAGLMALKFLDSYGTGSTSDAVECMEYIVNQKKAGVNVRVVNCSWGSPPASEGDRFLQDAIEELGRHDILVIAAAGNEASNNDAKPVFPASSSSPNVIAVASTDNKDKLSSFSNTGKGSVHVAAPGSDIISTFPVTGTKLFMDDMEKGKKFASGGSGGTWAVTGESGFSPVNSLSDSPGGKYQNDTDSWAIFGPVDLSGVQGKVTLEYQADLDLEAGGDALLVEASSDGAGKGADWIQLEGWTGDSKGYSLFQRDITFLSGRPQVYLRFRLVTDETITKDGVHIDDIAVSLEPDTVQPKSRYAYKSGTSMAAAFISGAAALMASVKPEFTAGQIKNLLMSTADQKSLPVISGGRINAAKAIGAISGGDLSLAVETAGRQTLLRASFFVGGEPQKGRRVSFFKDGSLVGKAAVRPDGTVAKLIRETLGVHTVYAQSDATASMPFVKSKEITYEVRPPAVASVSPAASAPGGLVTVTGTDFGSKPGSVVLAQGRTKVRLRPLAWSDTTITFATPRRKAGEYQLSILNSLAGSGAAAFRINPPSVRSLDPAAAGPGEIVTVYGEDFGYSKGAIILSGARKFRVRPLTWSDGQASFRVPKNVSGGYDITVRNTSGESREAVSFSVAASPR